MAERFIVDGAFPFHKMNVGDWFLVPTRKMDGARYKANNFASSRNFKLEGYGNGWKFQFRRDKERPGFHCCTRVPRPLTKQEAARMLADPNYME